MIPSRNQAHLLFLMIIICLPPLQTSYPHVLKGKGGGQKELSPHVPQFYQKKSLFEMLPANLTYISLVKNDYMSTPNPGKGEWDCHGYLKARKD